MAKANKKDKAEKVTVVSDEPVVVQVEDKKKSCIALCTDKILGNGRFFELEKGKKYEFEADEVLQLLQIQAVRLTDTK